MSKNWDSSQMEPDFGKRFGNAWPLAEFIQGISDELRKAQVIAKTDKKSDILKLKSCELNLSVTFTEDATAGVKFWVVDLSGNLSKENVQSVTITLDPIGRVIEGVTGPQAK